MKNTLVTSLITIATVTPIAPPPGEQPTQACERLTSTVLSATRVTLAETIALGTFTMPTIAGQASPPANAFTDLPAWPGQVFGHYAHTLWGRSPCVQSGPFGPAHECERP